MKQQDILNEKQIKNLILNAMLTLSAREERIIRLRFFLNKTISYCANAIGISYGRVRQIEAKAIRKLRHPSRSRKLEDILNFHNIENDIYKLFDECNDDAINMWVTMGLKKRGFNIDDIKYEDMPVDRYGELISVESDLIRNGYIYVNLVINDNNKFSKPTHESIYIDPLYVKSRTQRGINGQLYACMMRYIKKLPLCEIDRIQNEIINA